MLFSRFHTTGNIDWSMTIYSFSVFTNHTVCVTSAEIIQSTGIPSYNNKLPVEFYSI